MVYLGIREQKKGDKTMDDEVLSANSYHPTVVSKHVFTIRIEYRGGSYLFVIDYNEKKRIIKFINTGIEVDTLSTRYMKVVHHLEVFLGDYETEVPM